MKHRHRMLEWDIEELNAYVKILETRLTELESAFNEIYRKTYVPRKELP